MPNRPSGNIRRPHEHDSEMTKDQILQAKEPWYRRLLGRVNRRSVRYDGTTITVEEPHPENHQAVDASTLTGVTLTKGITTNSLTIRTKDGQVIEADGLAKSASADLHRVLSNEIQERKLDEAAAHQANQLAQVIHHKADELQRALPAERYIRHSTAIQLRDTIQHFQHECTDRVRRHLDPATTSSLNIIDELAEVLSNEERRGKANEDRTDAEAKRVSDATTDILPSGLTHEQARAIATYEDATLVLAGAGTGKTAVIIGKIAHLVRNQGVPPETILALAFNRKAAMEIRERLPEDLKGAHVSTFCTSRDSPNQLCRPARLHAPHRASRGSPRTVQKRLHVPMAAPLQPGFGYRPNRPHSARTASPEHPRTSTPRPDLPAGPPATSRRSCHTPMRDSCGNPLTRPPPPRP